MQWNAELTVGCLALATFGYVRMNLFHYNHLGVKVPWNLKFQASTIIKSLGKQR